jgi:hypothetical protein
MTIPEIVNSWFASLNGGALGRATEAYNQVAAAIPDLIGRLGGAPPEPEPQSEAEPQLVPAEAVADTPAEEQAP